MKKRSKSNKVKEETPFWKDAGYTAQEWNLRKKFEQGGCDDYKYSAFVNDLDEFDIYGNTTATY